ncbi:sensor domain-containing diguanylate cyclase/phosphohydrolase [Clostridium peptidivorans]|uniref:sensor domain-containing diguanylate cyclase/phosphohydrolase n=1 Tax=Clostridium peptidivorans TaxID=100174 RepID=UPI000BE36D27|nr:HD domain-containing phosphohydrolase [Clostridium peptidivorans]
MDNKFYSDILEKAPFGYALQKVILNDDGDIDDCEYIEINDSFEKLTGLNKTQVIGKRATEVFPNVKGSDFDWISHYGNTAINRVESEFEQYLEDTGRWYKVKIYSPKKYYVITFFIDISNEIKEKELFKSTLISIAEGVIAVDLHGNIIMINKTAEKLISCEEENTLHKKVQDVFKIYDKNDEKEITNTILENRSENTDKDNNVVLKTRKCTNVPIVYNISPIKDDKGILYGRVISFRDITDKVAKEKEIVYINHHDSLTGAYNRNFFNEKIKSIDIEENLPISIIMGDINGLKLTNDAFGHLMGDKLLIAASNTLKNSCRTQDMIIRWGGDEFIVLLPKTKEKDAEKIIKRTKEECKKEDIGIINVSISLGFSTKKNNNEDIMRTITNAEEMMYKIKMFESKSQKSETLKIIMDTLYQKSTQDAEHSKNVSEICKAIGIAMKLSEKEIHELELLGNMHDIGKISISENILNKSDKLNEEEWNKVKKHSEVGYHIISSSNDLAFLGNYILAHHEWYDGSGYPKGLKGKKIPLMSRILSIADAYDAMISDRPYRKAFTKNEAVKEIIKYSGKQFDPNLGKIFVDKVVKTLNSQ